jgi:hypothetical protein
MTCLGVFVMSGKGQGPVSCQHASELLRFWWLSFRRCFAASTPLGPVVGRRHMCYVAVYRGGTVSGAELWHWVVVRAGQCFAW